MRDQIYRIVMTALEEINEDLDQKVQLDQGEDVALFGREGHLDSMALVSLIVAIEQAVEEEMEVSLTLADEKAMSQQRSPFRTIGSLVDYVTSVVQGEV